MILTNARVVTCDAQNRVLDGGSVEILEDGSLGFIRPGRTRGGEAIDLGGRLLMPALINCHTHLYSTFARGLVLPGPRPANFRAILKQLWWRLDCALREEDLYYSALVALIDSAKCGVGTVIDHHSSPKSCAGSLDEIARAFRKIGLRGATCYETSDRNGREAARHAIRENVRFIERGSRRGLVQSAFGLHAAFTLADRTLRACAEANHSLRAPFHVHVAEDRCDRGAIPRLAKAGILDHRTLAAHCVHTTAADREILALHQVNVVHNPQSNCSNAVGTPDISDLARRGVLVGLGSDGYSPSVWDEFRTALHVQTLRARDPRGAYAGAIANNRAIVRKLWGLELGRLETGARADLVVLDYFPPTPLSPLSQFGHFLFGISHAPVHSLIVNGRYVLREGNLVNVDERRVAARALALAKALWERL